MPSPSHKVVALLLSTTLALAALSAHGKGPNKSIEKEYKAAVKLETSGDIAGALAAFEAIPVEKRDASVRLHIASCKHKLGRLLDAQKDYEAIKSDPKSEPAAVDTAASDLDALLKRIPKLNIRASAATKDVSIELDGAVVTPPLTRGVDPGTHVVTAVRGEAVVFKREVVLTEGTTIDVEVDAPPPAPPPTKSDKPMPQPAPESSAHVGGTQRTLGWISIGIGGAAAIGAGAAYLSGNGAANEYAASCGPRSCDESLRDSVKRWDTIALVSGGLALVGIGVGTVLILTSPRASVSVQPTTGAFHGLLVVGSF